MYGNKKILAVSFEGTRPAQGAAMVDGGDLYIRELREITVEPYAWLQTMLRDMEEKAKAGWVVMVEDRTASFPAPATSFNFDEIGQDGRTNMQASLDWYFTLKGRGHILMEPAISRYAMGLGGETDMIYAKNDEKGRLIYCVNWKEFSGAHRALLMCVAGACMEEPLSDRWMNIFTGNIPKAKKPNTWPVFRVMKDLWRKQQLDLEARIEAMERQKNVQR